MSLISKGKLPYQTGRLKRRQGNPAPFGSKLYLFFYGTATKICIFISIPKDSFNHFFYTKIVFRAGFLNSLPEVLSRVSDFLLFVFLLLSKNQNSGFCLALNPGRLLKNAWDVQNPF